MRLHSIIEYIRFSAFHMIIGTIYFPSLLVTLHQEFIAFVQPFVRVFWIYIIQLSIAGIWYFYDI